MRETCAHKWLILTMTLNIQVFSNWLDSYGSEWGLKVGSYGQVMDI